MKRINILLILWASIAAKASADRFSAPDTLHRRSTYHEDVPESDDYLDSPDETEPDDNDVSNYELQDLVISKIHLRLRFLKNFPRTSDCFGLENNRPWTWPR